jgi:hypothetical protein
MLRSISDTRAFCLAATAAAIVLLCNVEAHAHDWYPWECCSGQDCAPIPLKESPVERNGGFELIDGRHISYKDLKPSPDGQWHLCEQKWPTATKDRKILCLYAPIGGV